MSNRNWSEDNAGLKQRGSLIFWIDESVLESWIVPNLSGKPGASVLYSDLAIMTMVTLKSIYGLAGRQCQRLTCRLSVLFCPNSEFAPITGMILATECSVADQTAPN